MSCGSCRRIAARRDPFGDARVVEVLDRLTHEPVVAGDVERDERLEPRVADVLELLVVRRVHVRLERADARAVPVHRHMSASQGRSLAKRPRSSERIRGEDPVQVVHAERLVGGLDVELHVAARAPVQRLEAAPLAAVRAEHVAHAADRPARRRRRDCPFCPPSRSALRRTSA